MLKKELHEKQSQYLNQLFANCNIDGLNNPLVRLNKQFESEVQWKKIYIDLREVVSGSTSAQYFEFTLNSILPEGVNSAEINIDNVKAVHF